MTFSTHPFNYNIIRDHEFIYFLFKSMFVQDHPEYAMEFE